METLNSIKYSFPGNLNLFTLRASIAGKESAESVNHRSVGLIGLLPPPPFEGQTVAGCLLKDYKFYEIPLFQEWNGIYGGLRVRSFDIGGEFSTTSLTQNLPG